MTVRLLVEAGPHPGVSRADVGRRARAMLDALQIRESELSVVLTGDDQIRELNRFYRNKNRPTDVLAFPQLGEDTHRLLGDVVVSVPTARRRAEARGLGLMSELTTLLAHGLLHLLGWDHDTPAKDRRMRRETARLCALAERASVLRRASVKARTRARANGNSAGRRTSRVGR